MSDNWNTLMFIADDKCPTCFAEGNFQSIDGSEVLYYCPNGCRYFTVDVSKDREVITYLSSRTSKTGEEDE